MTLPRFCSFARRLRATFAPAALILACICPAFAQRLPSTVIPTHYDLSLTPDLKAATFSGVESIAINIAQPTSAITLNAVEIVFQSVTIDAGGSQQTAAVSLDNDKQQATFTFPAAVSAGKATLHIQFTGILNNQLRGFYLSKTSRRNYAVTQFESTDARRAFPCFDEPALKATFDVSLVIDAADTAISNSPILSDTPGPGPGKHTLRFSTTPRMSTYLVAFLVGDFQCAAGRQDGVDLRVCSTPDKVALAPYALDIEKFVLHYYDNYFGIHFPLKKLDLIGIPDFEAGAMENFGAITFREDELLIDPKTAPISSQQNVGLVIAHEMAHQWFGDLVTMQWWDNIWLNEGFATWMENKPVAAMHPEWNIPQMVARDLQRTMDTDAQPTTRPIRAKADTPDEIDQMFDGIAYGKASHVLLMVENFLGEETFRQGVHAYLAAHEYGNATAEDFWGAQTATSHKPVDKIMESLVAQQGVPLLAFAPPVHGSVEVHQHRFFLSPSVASDPSEKWTLPVCFKATASGKNCAVLTPSSTRLPVPASGLFFANAGSRGYYRTSYAPADYHALAAQVETALTPEERISLNGDEWAQVRAGKATVGEYLDLTAALSADPNAHVVSAAAENIGAIADQVASTRQERDELAAWVRRTFAPEYKKLGPPAPGDSPNTRELRATLFGLLAYRGNDPQIIAESRRIAGRYLSDPASVDPTLAQTALGVAAEYGDAALFEQLQKVYETSSEPEKQETALRLLAQFTDPTLRERAFDYAVSGKVRNQDSVFQLGIALQIPENRDAAWNFVKTHWDQVQAEFTTEMGADMVQFSGSFCTAEARDEVKSFYATHPVAASDVELRHALEHIDGCVELRRLQESNLQNWLAAHAAH